jgi:hypothetical protein
MVRNLESAGRFSWLGVLQLVFPQQMDAVNLALDGARHAVQPDRDLLVGVPFDLPQGDLPQLRLLEQVEQTPALVRRRGGFRGGRLAGQ